MLNGKALLFGIFMFSAGIVISWLMYGDPGTVQAIAVKGGETITTDKDNATFKVFLDNETTVMTDATTINAKLTGGDKGTALKIAEQASKDLQFLADFHQSLADVEAENPCPTLAEWEAAGGVQGGTEPNPTEFPLCDPDVLYDPGKCNIFWEDINDKETFRGDPRETLTSRNVLVLISWDGTVYNHHFRDPGMGSPPVSGNSSLTPIWRGL